MGKITLTELNEPLSSEEMEEINHAVSENPVFDEDSPELSLTDLSQFRKLHTKERNKQTVSLRLSPDTIKLAKSYGKGYTSFLSRLIETALMDEELVKKCI